MSNSGGTSLPARSDLLYVESSILLMVLQNKGPACKASPRNVRSPSHTHTHSPYSRIFIDSPEHSWLACAVQHQPSWSGRQRTRVTAPHYTAQWSALQSEVHCRVQPRDIPVSRQDHDATEHTNRPSPKPRRPPSTQPASTPSCCSHRRRLSGRHLHRCRFHRLYLSRRRLPSQQLPSQQLLSRHLPSHPVTQ